MKGILSEIVIFPRYVSLVGEGVFESVPVDLSAFDGVALEVWRGVFLTTSGGGGGSFEIYLQESHDAVAWTNVTLDGISQPIQSDDAIDLCRFTVGKKWFRISVNMSEGTDAIRAAMNIWASGYGVRRVV